MRRSKSNPAKYARNYRQISQRRMTEEEQHAGTIVTNSVTDDSMELVTKKQHLHAENEEKQRQNLLDLHAILSPELLQQAQQDDADQSNNLLILPPRVKKIKDKKVAVKLDPMEIRQEIVASKNQKRKFLQMEKHKQQKAKRAELYQKLEQTKVTQTELDLLKSSSTRGAKETKKQALRRLSRKERAGILLSEGERDLLYCSNTPTETIQAGTTDGAYPVEGTSTVQHDGANDRSTNIKKATPAIIEKPSNSAALLETEIKGPTTGGQVEQSNVGTSFAQQVMANLTFLKGTTDEKAFTTSRKRKEEEERTEQHALAVEKEDETKRVKYIPPPPVVLKTAATLRAEEESKKAHKQKEVHAEKEKKCTYKKGIVQVKRPSSVEESRFFLPVCEMEYEIVEAAKANDVVVLCAETGSGKSTQVPQFLYEAGFTGQEDENAIYNYDMGSHSKFSSRASSVDGMIIGVTQPRRVAAISTAKRVAFEMGRPLNTVSTGKTSGNKGNLVAYQTRYETAGMGSDTRIKFMTDGVLLQEIQSDLLLRQYSAICLDELHERNLNGDVLLGLLSSATLPLRRKAAEEGSLPPLKLIIMSATLRVEDFTSNGSSRLFTSPPAVVRVPGRNFPVTVHHSKVTNLDDYETLAFEKVCKIHRNLPDGGILVFLTGRQEILRMANRLRQRFSSRSSQNITSSNEKNDVFKTFENVGLKNDPIDFREMDDEEIDGDLFQKVDGFDDVDDSDNCDEIATEGSQNDKLVHILPLYSMLSTEDQAKVFAPVPEGHRLIVIATNIAETSITIPDIKYVVDTGRQKSRNYHPSSGIVSYDIMWISQAAADQRAGRAGRCGPGHCYRLYSSSLYSRHLDKFSTPEILTLSLEDVVLQMKAMNISNVGSFPFPTAPNTGQLKAALKVLNDIGLIENSNISSTGGDGRITCLGRSVSRLPLNARFGKMLLVGAQADVLDYTIAIVAILSEVTPFLTMSEKINSLEKDNDYSESDQNEKSRVEQRNQWFHPHGDVLAALVAVGANSFAGRGARGASELNACKRFCEENGLSFVVMQRIQKLRKQLAKLVKLRMPCAKGIASRTGGVMYNMPPPNRLQENILSQSVLSGFLDNVAQIAPPGSVTGRLANRAYYSCNPAIVEPIFIDHNSFLFTKDFRKLPQFVCYGSLVRKPTKDGSTIACMTNVTCVDQTWLGILAEGSPLLTLGEPLLSPPPTYDTKQEAVLCSISTKYGHHGWPIPPVRRVMYDYLETWKGRSSLINTRDSFRWFARALLEGKVMKELENLPSMLNDSPAIITARKPDAKVVMLVSACAENGVDNGPALRRHWAEVNEQFLFRELKAWTKKESFDEAKRLWVNVVKQMVHSWRKNEAP